MPAPYWRDTRRVMLTTSAFLPLAESRTGVLFHDAGASTGDQANAGTRLGSGQFCFQNLLHAQRCCSQASISSAFELCGFVRRMVDTVTAIQMSRDPAAHDQVDPRQKLCTSSTQAGAEELATPQPRAGSPQFRAQLNYGPGRGRPP